MQRPLIVFLLLVSVSFSQDTLMTKTGKLYTGTYLYQRGDIVYFQPEGSAERQFLMDEIEVLKDLGFLGKGLIVGPVNFLSGYITVFRTWHGREYWIRDVRVSRKEMIQFLVDYPPSSELVMGIQIRYQAGLWLMGLGETMILYDAAVHRGPQPKGHHLVPSIANMDPDHNAATFGSIAVPLGLLLFYQHQARLDEAIDIYNSQYQ
jgi:hypothetical protein